MADAPRATPPPKPRAGNGCLLALLVLPVVIVGGLVLGTALRSDDDTPDEQTFTVDDGMIGDVTWRVEAERDVQGDTCAFLYTGDEQVGGSCEAAPEATVIGDQTVVFGKAPADASTVRVQLDDGQVVQIATVTAGEVEGRYFVQVVDGQVAAESFAPSP